jgi:hypothetical protein
MKNILIQTIAFLSVYATAQSATIVMTINGSYSSAASASLANKNWEAKYTYDTLLPSNGISFGTYYYTALIAASFSVNGDTYKGVSGPLSSTISGPLGGTPTAQAGSYALVTNSSMWDRIEFRSNLFLDGDSNSQSLEVYEIVLADTTPSLWNSTSLPESFDFNQIDYIFMSTRSGPSSALDSGTVQSVSFQVIPEPSSAFLMIIGSITLMIRRYR